MKPRKPLKRYTRLAPGKPLAKRSAKRRDAVRENAANPALQEWFESKTRCAVCWVSAAQLRDPFRKIDFHHLMGRSIHGDDPRNYLPLDSRLHRHFHAGGEFDDINGDRLPELTPGMLIGVKAEMEPSLFDPDFLCWLKGWRCLVGKWEPVPLPAIFLIERERNGHF